MKLTEQRATSERGGDLLTQVGGWIAIVFGVVHILVSPIDSRDTWSNAIGEGWWNTFTLDKAITLAQLERSETFWISLGSFGVPMLVIGCYIVWSIRQQHRVPGWIGWIILVWALVMATAVPVSPAWALVVCGGLIVLGDRPDRRPGDRR